MGALSTVTRPFNLKTRHFNPFWPSTLNLMFGQTFCFDKTQCVGCFNNLRGLIVIFMAHLSAESSVKQSLLMTPPLKSYFWYLFSKWIRIASDGNHFWVQDRQMNMIYKKVIFDQNRWKPDFNFDIRPYFWRAAKVNDPSSLLVSILPSKWDIEKYSTFSRI